MPDNAAELRGDPPLPEEEITTLAQWLWRLRYYENDIFVMHAGYPTSLAQLPAQVWGEKVAGFLERGAMPSRISRDPDDVGA